MPWYRLVNMDSAEKKARIDIYDDIGEFTDWWTGEKTGLAARDFSATLQALGDVGEIELHINSRGGSVPDGIQIYNELRRHQAKVTVVIDGQAASIASIIAMAGDEVVMPANTSMWVHNPVAWLNKWIEGNSKDLRDLAQQVLNLADDLETTEEQLIGTYMARANDKLNRDDLKEMLDKETTITAEQAVEWGLADRIEDPLQQASSFDMSKLLQGAGDKFSEKIQAAQNQSKPGPKKSTEPVAMDAVAVIAACRAAGFEALATPAIEAGVTQEALQEHISLARNVKDTAVAAGLENLSDQFIQAAQQGPVEAMRVALSVNMESADPKIDANLSTRHDAVRTINPAAIYRNRNQRGNYANKTIHRR